MTLSRKIALFSMFLLATSTVRAVSPTPPAPVDTDFGLALYRHVAGAKGGNLVISPHSIAMALSMTALGAKGESLAELRTALGAAVPDAAWHTAVGEANRRLLKTANGEGLELTIANSLWPDEQFALKPAFTTAVQEHYGAGPTRVNYRAPDAARTTINQWVEEQTRNRIQDLMPPGAITDMTRLTLVNAVYFKGVWQDPFDPGVTRPEPFHRLDGSTVKVPTMRLKKTLRYAEDETSQSVALNYRGGRLSMWLMVPRARDGLSGLTASLTAARLTELRKTMRSRETLLLLPRFTMTFGTGLAEALKALDIRSPFDPQHADFSGMAGKPGDLFLQAAVHKAFIQVDEAGTEAAAATGMAFGVTSMPSGPPVVLRADRPFLFLILDNASGTVLFAGQCVDPGALGS